MYAVIFEARIKQLDDAYFTTAARMRELATNNYGCLEFTSVTEGDREISISYWQRLEDIQRWKQDKEHRQAQQRGRAQWYQHYQVNITKVVKAYAG